MILQSFGKHSWSLTVNCTGDGNRGGGCGSTLVIAESDVYRTHTSAMDGSGDYYYTISCPVCGVKTDIPSDKLPQFVKDAVGDRAKPLNTTVELAEGLVPPADWIPPKGVKIIVSSKS